MKWQYGRKNFLGYFCTTYEIERFRIYGCDVFGAPSRWLTGVPTGWDSWINKLRILYNNYKYVCTKLFIKIIKKKVLGRSKKGWKYGTTTTVCLGLWTQLDKMEGEKNRERTEMGLMSSWICFKNSFFKILIWNLIPSLVPNLPYLTLYRLQLALKYPQKWTLSSRVKNLILKYQITIWAAWSP